MPSCGCQVVATQSDYATPMTWIHQHTPHAEVHQNNNESTGHSSKLYIQYNRVVGRGLNALHSARARAGTGTRGDARKHTVVAWLLIFIALTFTVTVFVSPRRDIGIVTTIIAPALTSTDCLSFLRSWSFTSGMRAMCTSSSLLALAPIATDDEKIVLNSYSLCNRRWGS